MCRMQKNRLVGNSGLRNGTPKCIEQLRDWSWKIYWICIWHGRGASSPPEIRHHRYQVVQRQRSSIFGAIQGSI